MNHLFIVQRGDDPLTFERRAEWHWVVHPCALIHANTFGRVQAAQQAIRQLDPRDRSGLSVVGYALTATSVTPYEEN